jgi:hypothetical protein
MTGFNFPRGPAGQYLWPGDGTPQGMTFSGAHSIAAAVSIRAG